MPRKPARRILLTAADQGGPLTVEELRDTLTPPPIKRKKQ